MKAAGADGCPQGPVPRMKVTEPTGGTRLLGVSSQDCGTALASLKVGRGSVRVARRALMIQWQDGKKVIVWLDEPAPGKPRFPTPPWRERP